MNDPIVIEVLIADVLIFLNGVLILYALMKK